MPPYSMSSLIQAISSTAQSHRQLSFAELLSTIPADVPGRHKKTGAAFQNRAVRDRRPRSCSAEQPATLPPSRSVYIKGGGPVSVQIQ